MASGNDTVEARGWLLQAGLVDGDVVLSAQCHLTQEHVANLVGSAGHASNWGTQGRSLALLPDSLVPFCCILSPLALLTEPRKVPTLPASLKTPLVLAVFPPTPYPTLLIPESRYMQPLLPDTNVSKGLPVTKSRVEAFSLWPVLLILPLASSTP